MVVDKANQVSCYVNKAGGEAGGRGRLGSTPVDYLRAGLEGRKIHSHKGLFAEKGLLANTGSQDEEIFSANYCSSTQSLSRQGETLPARLTFPC